MTGITAFQQYYYEAEPDDEELYHCPYAPRCSHGPTRLKHIYRQYLNSHIKPFQCEEQTCNGIRFSYKADYNRHKNEIHGEERLCPYDNCKRSNQGQGFKRGDNMKRHVKLVHIKTNKKLHRPRPNHSGIKKMKNRNRKTDIINSNAKSDPTCAQALHSPESCQENSETKKAKRKISELENKNADMGALIDGQLKKVVHMKQKNKKLQQENETIQQENETLQQENETLQQGNKTLRQENETLQQENEKLRQENFALQVWSRQSLEILSSANTLVSTQNWNLDHQISQVSAIELDQPYPFGWIDFWSDCEPHNIVPNPELQTYAPAPVTFTDPFAI
ncbi:hypothetical protein K469DRAFT_755075 [Zopfia rhizophila CBS 207.26]|uniref:C2H2-type domain-containing protein n=1 Tax=Zopfia rhizophila CBS 207.26 TaxID=1314779 RepID=A0A6A6DEV9_9PEZI|nr:hypothetical protein K469DRAFT_755075 [Zopfia rhizophila CBS 207.26]